MSPQRGYDDLQTIVPTCQQQDFSIGSQKLSKAIVLQKSMTRESPGSGWGQQGSEEARAFYPLSAWPWLGGGCGAGGEWDGAGGETKSALSFWLRLPLCPPPPTPAIDYIQFLHKEKKKQEEEVSMLRKDVTALKIMKV